MKKFAVLLYPDFSLQEITCLTSSLTLWFGEKIDYIASENKEYVSEDGLHVIPDKITTEIEITDYDCVILPGTINPLPALFDDKLIEFLKNGMNSNILFAAISSSPILLSKSGILDGKKFTAGYFMQMTEIFPFIEKENFIHKGIVEDDNVITGIGMFFREFAATVLRRLGYDIGHNFMRKQSDDYAQDELTFYWSDEDYKEFLEELKGYNDKEDKTNNKLKFAELNIRNMRNFDIEKEMYRLAVELIEKRYPVGWGGAGVIHTAKGHYFTSVSLDSANASAVLCIETGAMIEAHKFNEEVTHCMCLVREDENAPYQVLSPCGICQERLAFWGRDVQVAVTTEDNSLLFVPLSELQPYHWSNAYLDDELEHFKD